MNIRDSIKLVEACIEEEANKWFRTVCETSESVADIQNAIWELGNVKKDGTGIEQMLHHLIYKRASDKARILINEVEKSALKEKLSHSRQ